jgi:hypothetical protein
VQLTTARTNTAGLAANARFGAIAVIANLSVVPANDPKHDGRP